MDEFPAINPSAYSLLVAQNLMTLAAIAYVDDPTKSLQTLRQEIIQQLGVTSYATKGQWSLAWGPVVYQGTDNLAYVAQFKFSPATQPVYAVVLRGTIPDFNSVWEDIPTGQSDFSAFSAPQATVSSQFLHALLGVAAMRDPLTGTTLLKFLRTAISGTQSASVYVTGHSQGGALVPMMLGMLQTQLSPAAIKFAAYSFAGPTSGNPRFAQWVDQAGTLQRVVNPLDVVPFGYAAIDRLIPDHVPKTVTPGTLEYACLTNTLDIIEDLLALAGTWQQPAAPQVLPRKQATGSLLAQASYQHHCNTYLTLLGAPIVTLWRLQEEVWMRVE